jgi:hypothetical protein
MKHALDCGMCCGLQVCDCMEVGNTTCNPHPDAPHGFNRDASHSAGRYVCDCEGWMPPPTRYQLDSRQPPG